MLIRSGLQHCRVLTSLYVNGSDDSSELTSEIISLELNCEQPECVQTLQDSSVYTSLQRCGMLDVL